MPDCLCDPDIWGPDGLEAGNGHNPACPNAGVGLYPCKHGTPDYTTCPDCATAAAEGRRWEAEATEPRTLTVQQVADWIHQGYGRNPARGEHSAIASCGCMHIARSLFGLNGMEYMYWPDGKGGNAWDQR